MIYIIPFDLLLDAEMNGVVRSNIIDIRLEGLVFKWVRQIDVHVERPAAEKNFLQLRFYSYLNCLQIKS